jgi:hypothetical protein
MKRYAVNVVLLPPEPVMDIALEWNRKLVKNRPANIILDKNSVLPHVSLAMGCLRADNLERANALFQSILSKHKAIDLRIPHIRTVNTSSGDSVICFDISPTDELTKLHEAIVTGFRPLLTQDATADDIHGPPPVSSSALNWINNYIPHHCFDHFWPHITLGFGEPPGHVKAFSFQASRLAICHLGNHCTCRSILSEVALK